MRKIILSVILMASVFGLSAQINYFELSGKTIYFGISMGGNYGTYKIIPKPLSSDNDTVVSFRGKYGPGFNLGIIGNLQLHEYFDIRFVPSLVFSDKSVEYTYDNGRTDKKTVSAIYTDLPLDFRYKSKPIKDFRIFVIAGMRYTYDLNSLSKARNAEDKLKLSPHDLSVEYGIGFQYYFPYFILAPEFKVSHGILNLNTPNEGLINQRLIDKIFSRMFTFTINFEG